MSDVFIIAEAGVNHNGDLGLALELVDAAAASGADAVKFQTFQADKLATANAVKADYQKKSTCTDESQLEMLKKLELDHSSHFKLYDHCKKQGIEFLSSAFDLGSLEFLVQKLNFNTLKISSGEITNGPLLLAHAKTGRNLIVSTGMSSLEEVQDALAVIAFGLVNGNESNMEPSSVRFQEAYHSSNGRLLLKKKVTLLHCTTEYPAPLDETNLNAMQAMRNEFGLSVGYSDHTEGVTVPVVAAALGASVIEKHFTLDRDLPGPDQNASLEPDELKLMVKLIRDVEKVLGDGIKVPVSSERDNRNIARKSLVAACNIYRGEVFTEENIVIKRPGTGRSPMEYWGLLGEVSPADYLADEVIQ
ncbi:MAG: N-acetylneuraminate synthase [Gammaproteobacteria bacterium]|nr:N-acetylneuraminate synthase [Gammaproteobacteria bacterium]